jgi:non-specific serine/threonine protein kinase/serine/threonine-protein kinase
MHEGRPVPKVIDFGIARALERDASQLLTATGDGRVVGTPEYMSPEQAAADPDLDTRTDVYSLGAILYEMLTGSVPFPFGDSSPAAVEKVLRHDDPPRPSTRVATLGPATAIVAQARGTSPGRLARRLAGELAWIVMKALEKDRDRRYSSVADLAADVERHLEHRPVIAGPPSLGYRVRKFVRRHRVPVAAAAAVVAALVLGLFGTGWMAVVAARERGAAEIARDQARRDADAAEAARGFLESMLAAANPTTGAATGEVSRDVRVADVLDRAAATLGETFAGQPEVEASLRETLGRTYLELGLFDEGEQQFERAAAIYRAARGDDDARTLKASHDLASIFERQGRFDEAGELFRTTLERQRRALGDRHPDTLASQGSLNDILFQQGKLEHPAEVYRELVERSHDILGDDHPNTLQSRNDLGVVLGSEGRYEESVAAYRISVEHHERALGADHPDSLRARSNLGGALISLGELAEAAALHETLVADMETIMGPDHPETLRTQSNLGAMHFKQGDRAAAAATWSEVLETYRRTLGPDHYLALVTLANVARVTQDIGRLAEAEGLYRELVAAAARSLPERHPNLGIYRGGLGVCLMRQERYAEAETELLAALEANRAVLGPEHPRTVVATERLTELYGAWGRPQSQTPESTPESPGTS